MSPEVNAFLRPECFTHYFLLRNREPAIKLTPRSIRRPHPLFEIYFLIVTQESLTHIQEGPHIALFILRQTVALTGQLPSGLQLWKPAPS
jgi:hypothetical protein